MEKEPRKRDYKEEPLSELELIDIGQQTIVDADYLRVTDPEKAQKVRATGEAILRLVRKQGDDQQR